MFNDKDDTTNLVTTGNAIEDGLGNCNTGWFIGHFIDSRQMLRSTDKLEVKWGVHPANDKKKYLLITQKREQH